MNNLFLLIENITNGYHSFFLNIVSLAAVLCGILVIVSKNPIVSVLFLIGLFLTIAGYLMMLGINFIGLSYLLVYVGAVSILFLFILMLINVRVSELISDTSNSIPLAVLIGIYFNSTISSILPSNEFSFNNDISNISNISKDMINNNSIKETFNLYGTIAVNNGSSSEIAYVSSPLWDGSLAETSHITALGNIIYTSYPIWLIITSIILLLAMVGAIVITIRQKAD